MFNNNQYNNQYPEYHIHQVLGFPPIEGMKYDQIPNPISQQLNEEKNTELLREEDEHVSWVRNGHPMGESINNLNLSALGLGGLVRIAGGGAYGAFLRSEGGQENLKLTCDPLELVSDFLRELSENDSVLTEYGIEKNELEKISSGIEEAVRLAEKLREILSAADNKDTAKSAVDKLALELKNLMDDQGVVHFPLLDKAGKYTQMVRVDKEHGFSIIQVEDNPLGYLSSFDNINNTLNVKNLKRRQDCIAKTYLDPLTGREIEVFESQQFISYSAKNLDKLGDENFFRALIKGALYPAWVKDQDYDVEGIIHESLPKYVEGKRLEASDQHSQLFRKMYRHFDESDKDASFNSASAALYYLSMNPFFGVEENHSQAVLRFKKIKFLLQSQVFIAYVRKIDQDGSWNDVGRSEKMFLNDLMHQIMRSAEKLRKKEGLTHAQFSGFFATCRQLKQIFERPELVNPNFEISESEVKARMNVAAGLPSYPEAEAIQNITLAPSLENHFSDIGNRRGANRRSQGIEAKPAESLIEGLSSHHYWIDFSNGDLDQHSQAFEENIEHLNGLYENLSENPSLRSSFRDAEPSVKQAVFQLFERTLQDVAALLPIPSRGSDSYWAGLSPEQAERWMCLSEDLSKLLFKFSVLNKNEMYYGIRKQKHSAEDSILALAIYAIQLQIASNDPGCHLEGQNFSYLRYLKEMRDTKFVIQNPSIRKMVNELMRYFNPDWNVEEITRDFSREELDSHQSSLFCFDLKTDWGSVYEWRLDFVANDTKKSANQKYLEKILDEEGVREGVVGVLQNLNLEYDRKYEIKMREYDQLLEKYQNDKDRLEGNISNLQKEINAVERRYEESISDYFSDRQGVRKDWDEYLIENSRGYGGENRLEELLERLNLEGIDQNKIDQLIQLNTSKEDELGELREQLGIKEFELASLARPIEPAHQGHYPTDSVIDQLVCLLCHEEGRKFIPEKVNRILQNVIRAQSFTEASPEKMLFNDTLIHFVFKDNNWNPIPIDSVFERKILTCRLLRDVDDVDRVIEESISGLFGMKNSAYKLLDPFEIEGNSRILNRMKDDYVRSKDQNYIVASEETFFDLSLEKSRELRMLSMDPYDTVGRVIGFFRENISLLSRSDIRKYIEILLFRPDFLHSQLRDNPQIAKNMNAFILSAAGHYKEIKDIDTCVAVIRLGEQFKRSVRELTGDDSGFSDYRSLVLEDIIPTFQNDNAAKLKAYQTLMVLHAYNDVLHGGRDNTIKKQAVQDLLALRVCRQMQTSFAATSEIDRALIASAIIRYQPLLKNDVEDSDLTHAVRVALQDEGPGDGSLWDDVGGGVYRSGSYEINVNTGVVCSNGVPVVETPDWITNNETLARVYPFSFDSHTCQRTTQWNYVLHPNDPNKRVEILSYDDGENIEIIRLIDGQSYRYVPTPGELIANMPTVFDLSTVCWESDGRILAYQNGKKAYEIAYSRELNGENSVGSITRLKDGMIAQNFTTMKLDLDVPASLPDLGIPLPSIDTMNISSLFIGFPIGESDAHYIECWSSPDRGKVIVDFKRLGLSFEIFPEEIQSVGSESLIEDILRIAQDADPDADGEHVSAAIGEAFLKIRDRLPVHCQNFPGYSYSIPEIMQSFEGISIPYLTLRSNSGELKVLVPDLITNPEVIQQGRLFLDELEEAVNWIDFGVKKVRSDGKTHLDICSNEVLGQLVQLMLNAQQKEFSKMLEILNKINPLEAFSEKESRPLESIIGRLYDCNHPEANAILLKLILLIENNRLKYPKTCENESVEDDENREKLEFATVVAYDRYRENLTKATKFRLSDEEERQILEHLHAQLVNYLSTSKKRETEGGQSGGFFARLLKKAQSWFENTVKPTCALGIAEQRLGARYEALSTGSGKLGIRKVKWLSASLGSDEVPVTPFTEGNEIVKLFMKQLENDAAEIRVPDEEDIQVCLDLFEKNSNYWEENFVTLYHVARSGTEVQRSQLKDELDLTTHLHSPERTTISWVLAKPGRYPALEKMNQIIHDWKVDAPEKIQEAEDVLKQKRQLFDRTAQESRRLNHALNDLENRERGALGRFRSLNNMEAQLTRKREELERLKSAQQNGLKTSLLEREIAGIERNIEIIKRLQPDLALARSKADIAAKNKEEAEKELDKARSAVEKAIDNCEKKEEELQALFRSISPQSSLWGNLWTIIDRIVKPIFKVIAKGWKLFWMGRKFLNKHVYPVRDIFSTNQVSRNKEMMRVDSEFLVEIDQVFDAYLNQCVSKNFDLICSDDCDQDWQGDNGDDHLVGAKLKKEKEALEEYRQNIREPRIRAQLKDGSDLGNLREDLREKIETLNVSLVNQKETLIWHLNREIDDDPQACLIKQMNRLGQKGQLAWDDVRSLTLTGNMIAFREKTGLSETEAKRLLQGVGEYLVKATCLDQLRYILSIVEKALDSENGEQMGIFCTNIAEALLQKRHYTPNLSELSRLWYEYSNGYLYRKNQIDLLERTGFEGENEILVEAPTGFGKSKNYVATKDNEESEDHLVFNVHPRTIEGINSHDIQSQMRDAYGRIADRFHFQRSTPFSSVMLKKIYEDMQEDFIERRPINCSTESLQALELHFLLTMHDYQNRERSGGSSSEELSEIQEQIRYFIRILRAIKVYGWATIDESHVNLNPYTNKLIYTIGDSATLEIYQVELLEEMMNWLVTDDALFDIAKITRNEQAKVTEEEYALISQRIAEKYVEKYRIPDENRQEFLDFVLGKLDEVPAWIRQTPHAKKYALIKGVLSLVLKSCMNGYVDENFGLSILHFDKKEYAIAYSSSNTPKENEQNPSQFKNPHETMIKTYFTYLHKGLREEQVIKMLKQMQNEQLLQVETGVSLADTQANQTFVEIAGEGHSLHELREENMRNFYKNFKRNKKAIFYYIKKIIVPQLKLYDKTLVSTPQDLRSMFGSSTSLSATPQDPAAHGPDTVMFPMPGTQGQVSHLFLNKVDTENKIHQSLSSEPKDVMRSAIETLLASDHIKCIIDAGGLMRGLSNAYIAKALRKAILERGSNNQKIQAIQYFDVSRENFVMMEIESGTLSDPSVSKVPPSEVITLFDQPRCFGSDTVQDEAASALLLVNSRTDKAKAGQGAGRMRKWHLDQGMEVMMSPEDFNEVFSGREANIGDLLTLWISNLADQEAKENYQALLQQMDNELRRPALDRMLGIRSKDRDNNEASLILDQVPDADKALKLFRGFESLFVIDDSCDPWRLYAEIPTDTTPEESLDAHLSSAQAKAKKIRGFSSRQHKILEKRLKRYSSKWRGIAPDAENPNGVPPVSLPHQVKSSKIDTGTQVEVQVQTDTVVDNEIQALVKEEQFVRTPSKWSDSIQLFTPGWEKPTSQNVFLKRLSHSLSRLEPKNLVLKFAFRALAIGAGSALAAIVASVAGLAWPIIGAIGSILGTVGLGYFLYRTFSGSNIKYLNNCTYIVRDVMGIHLPKDIRRGASIFSPNLTVSNNYYALKTISWKETPQKPFTQEQKPIFNVLVIQDESDSGEKRLQMMIIDQNDSVYFRRRLQQDYETADQEESGLRKRKIAVFDAVNGLISVQGKNQFEEGELTDNPEFTRLLAQAKMVNGEVNYSEEEKHAITELAQPIGAVLMHGVQNHFLQRHPIKRAMYDQTSLHHAIEAVS